MNEISTQRGLTKKEDTHVVIIGAGFGGLAAAKALGSRRGIRVTVLDRRNYHLFQPLLYQVAMAGLSPADIASPIRAVLRKHKNIRVVQAEVSKISTENRTVYASTGEFHYDRLIVATGSEHHYFGSDQWESFAPGLKTLEQATEIRRRVLRAFERAESTDDAQARRAMLTFVIVGGGPTGVELAGAIGEMSRYTLVRDFRNIDPKSTRVFLIEAGERILPAFDRALSARAMQDLESLGVQVWTASPVSGVDESGVWVGEERVCASTVIWAAGVKASPVGQSLDASRDRQGRVHVLPTLQLNGHPDVFVIGDLAHVPTSDGGSLPALAPVAVQQGRHVGRQILRDGEAMPFRFVDKGMMATIGRRRAIVQRGGLQVKGYVAWWMWLLVHIYFLNGFRNRVLVLFQWAWSYLTFARGARLIVEKSWKRDDVRLTPDETGDRSVPTPERRAV